MKITVKLAFSNIRANIKRSILTLICVILSVAFISTVCGIAYSAIAYVSSTEIDAEAAEAVKKLAKGFMCACSVAGCLMIYSNFSISFEDRRKIIGNLSSLGMSFSQKLKMLLAEALIYAICGIIPGTFLGMLGAKLFYNSSVGVIASYTDADTSPFVLVPQSVVLTVILGVFSVIAASVIPALRISKLSVLDLLYGRTKVNISLKQGFVSRACEKLFGRVGKLAGQNYYNYKSNYRAIAYSLSGGTVFFMSLYCFFMYPIRYDMESGYYDPMYHSLLYLSIVFSVLVIIIFLICASGSASINIERRKHDFAVLKSLGCNNSQLYKMMIESVFLIYYTVIYSFMGSVLADYMICNFFRITDEPMLRFWFPISVFTLFIAADIVIGSAFEIYSVNKMRKINIIDAIK